MKLCRPMEVIVASFLLISYNPDYRLRGNSFGRRTRRPWPQRWLALPPHGTFASGHFEEDKNVVSEMRGEDELMDSTAYSWDCSIGIFSSVLFLIAILLAIKKLDNNIMLSNNKVVKKVI